MAVGVGWGNLAHAQTDVTDTYITNADFASGEDGWTQNTSGGFKDIGRGLIGTFVVKGTAATVDESHLATEYCAGFECRWASNFSSYVQTTSELAAGSYTLTFDVENVNGSTAKVTYDNLFKVEIGESTYVDSSTEWMNGKSSWTTHSINFSVTEAATATISFGYGMGSNGIPVENAPYVYVSHVKLYYSPIIRPTDVAIDGTLALTIGGTSTLTPTYTPSDANTDLDIAWATSDATVATVANGVVTAVGPGTATITATTANNVSATCEVTVTDVDAAAAPSFYAESLESGTNYYLYNAAAGAFLGTIKNGWGTQAGIAAHGIPFTATLISDGVYTLDSHTYNDGNSHFLNGTYVDGGSTNLYITSLGNGKFSISTADGSAFLTANLNNAVVANTAPTANSVLAQWYFVTKDNLVSSMASATEENPVDATFFISDPDFSRNHIVKALAHNANDNPGGETYPWEYTVTNYNFKGGNTGNMCAESWHSAGTISQTFTVPNGKYKVKCQGFRRQDNSTEESYLFANDEAKKELCVLNGNGEGTGESMGGASTSFSAGLYWNELEVTVTDGSLTIGIQGTANNWTIWDNFELWYLAPIDLSVYQEELDIAISTAEGLVDEPMNADVASALSAAINTYKGATITTEADFEAAIAAVKGATTDANTSIENYVVAKNYIDLSSTLDEAGQASYAADATVAEVKSAYEAATLVALTPEQTAALDAAIRVAAKAQTTPGADMTLAIVNPTINGDYGWTIEKSINGNGPLLNGTSFEYWSYTEGKGGFDYYQTITGLPAGKYTVTAYMFNSLSDKPDFEFVPGAGVYGTSAETKIAPVTEEGMVWHFYTTDQIIVTNGTLRIGIKNSNADNTMPARWVAADDFKLTFVEPITLQDYWDEIDALVAEAKSITGRQGVTPAGALAEAIVDGEAASGTETNLDAIEAVIEALTTAIANSKTSVAAYEIITAGVIPTNNAAGWEKDTPNGGLACNGWSTEANTDGSGMTTPFIQVHRGANEGALGAGRLYYTISNLEPGDKFVVSARARVYNEKAGSLDGGSFFVNETKVDIDEKGIACAADYANKGIYGVFYAVGTVDTEGKLQFGIEVAEGSELNWIAIKDVTIKDFTDTKLSEIAVSPNAPTVTTGTTITLTATVTPTDADDPSLMWTSSDPTVATDNNAGFVTALKAGTTTITATANDGGGAVGSAAITVADATAPAFYATEIATATDYYIVNAATGKFLGGGNNYGTRASLIEHGIPFTITKEESGKYTLDSHVYNKANSHYFRGDYVDQDKTDNIYITSIEGGRFSISTAESAEYVTAAIGNTIVANNAADANSSLAQWYFVSKTDRDKALAAASDLNPVDATYYIPNASFSRNMNTQYNENTWSVDAANSNLNSDTNCAESYQSTFEVKKTITNLPNGSYKVRAQAVANNAETGAVVFINEGEDGQTAAFDVMQNGENNMATCAASFAAGRYYTEWIPVTVENHTLTVGVKGGVAGASWCVWDNIELYMTGYTPVTEVTASIDNSEIEVNGTAQITASVTEGASFDAISYESSDVTVATVDENGLVTAVAEGTATITVKAEMENVSEEINVTVVKPAVIPSVVTVKNGEETITALELDATTNEVTLTAVVGEEGAPQAVVWASDDEAVATVSAEGVVTGVAPGTASITVTASGYDDVYATVEVTVTYPESTIPATVEVIDETEMTKTIYTLDDTNLIKNGSFEYPDAFYGWTAADDNTLSTTNFETLTTDAPNGNAYLHAKSNGGKDSDASIGTKWAIEHNKTYIFGYETKVNANGNAEYHKVSLTSNPNAEQYQVSKDSYPLSSTEWTKVQYLFESGSYDYLQFRARWLSGNASFDNFYLAEATVSQVIDLFAKEADYTALNEAIAGAESKTLGFLQDEFAPYNNVAALQALAAAKAIDQNVKNWASEVQAATAALNLATWTANTEEVNAVFDGSFETDYSGQTGNINPIGWQRVKGAAADGYNVRYMGGNEAGLQATSSGKALFTKQSAYYGYAEGYTMPLKANTCYKVSFIYGGWGDCQKDGYVSIADPEGNLVEFSPTDLPLDAKDANTNVDSWKTYEAIFQTGEAGDYVLGLRKKNYDTSGQSQYVYGDIQIFQVPVSEVTMRIKKTNKYGTFVAPFAVTLPEGVTAQKVIDLDANGTTLEMEDVDEVIPAHTPVVIYKGDFEEEDPDFETKFYGQATSTQTEATVGLLTGVYYEQPAPVDSYVLQNIGGKVAFYQVADGENQQPTMRPYSAYLTLPAGYAKPISLSFGDDEATAIAGIEALTSGNMEGIYTTSGAKVNSLQKGVNIIRTKDGKSLKVYVK